LQFIKTRKNRLLLAFVISFCILIPYVLLIFPYVENNIEATEQLNQEIKELTKPPEPYTFQVPIYFNFNGSSPFLSTDETEFGFLLTITYPNGTLIPNEVVDINVTAVMNNIVTSIDHVAIIFPNALSYPISFGENNFPLQAIVDFQNQYSFEAGYGNVFHNNYLELNTQILWTIEGDYTPVVGFFFKDGSSQIFEVSTFVIHVYPKEQLMQSENNRVSLKNNQANLELSKAIYWLSSVAVVVAIVTVFVQIVDKENYSQHQPSNQQTCPYLEEKRRKGSGGNRVKKGDA